MSGILLSLGPFKINGLLIGMIKPCIKAFRLTHSYDDHNHTAVFVSQKKDVVHQITGLNVLSLFDHATIGVDQQYRLGDWDLSWQS